MSAVSVQKTPDTPNLGVTDQSSDLSTVQFLLNSGPGAALTKHHSQRREGNIDNETEIQRAQVSLAAQFELLRAARSDAPVYVLEHGMDAGDLDDLLQATRACLAQHSVDEGWWALHPLPLLVAATEVGYAYKGTGTDFWPIFAERFGGWSVDDRMALSSLFQQSAARYGLAQPADTPWNHAFCHIAWPVLHSILPIELHRPLVHALRDVRAHLDVAASDAALIAPIRNRALLAGGVRLIAWLEDLRTAAAVVRHFLDPTGQHAIAAPALARIASDLARDDTADAALREARRRQKALEVQPARRVRRRRSEVETLFTPLVLRYFDQRWSLALKIPQMDQAARDSARSALDAIRWRALLWSQGRPVPGRSIFSDFPVPISVDTLPPSDTPLLGDIAALPLKQEAKDFLGSLMVKTAPPLLFSDVGADGDAVQLLSPNVTDSGRYIVLVGLDMQPPASAESLGRIVGMRVYRIDPSLADASAWLSEHGFAVRHSAQFAWIGDPEFEQHRPIRRFRRGAYLAFEISTTDNPCEALLIDPDAAQSVVTGTNHVLAGFTADKLGRHMIRYGAGEVIEFEIVEEEDHAPLLAVDTDSGTGGTGDLADRQVALRFDSSASLQEAALELWLVCDGTELARASDVLPDTPCRLGGDHRIWDALLGAETLERLLVARTAELCVSVRGLIEASFRFEQVIAPFAWQRNGAGELAAFDEAGELALFAVSPAAPLNVERAATRAAAQDIVLFRAGHGSPLQSGGLCVGPRIWRAADVPLPQKPSRLLRQFEGGRSDMADGHAMVDALIAWSAANVDHPVTQFRRGQVVHELELWLVEQFCGSEWARREAKLSAKRGSSFASAFLATCAQLQLGFADVRLSQAQRAHLDRILLRLINARALPISLETSREPIGEVLSAGLDDLFNEAYAILADEVRAIGADCPFDPDEDIDVGETSDNWDRALQLAATQAALIELVDLLRPLEASDALSLADFETMFSDEVVDLLHDWIGEHRPQHQARGWNRDLVEAAYWLFAKPAVAPRLAWRAAAERLLADRFSARAIRYAALRASARTVGK